MRRTSNAGIMDNTFKEQFMSALYTAHAHATGGRNGTVRSSDGVVDFSLAVPKEMGGPGGTCKTNPEQLFAAGYAACFGSACEFLAKMQKLPVTGVHVDCHVGIGPKAGGGFLLNAVLDVKVDGLDAAGATQLVHAAHQVCPYSNATRGNIDVQLNILNA
jgi:Ohr subfamily peroxiredoxin